MHRKTSKICTHEEVSKCPGYIWYTVRFFETKSLVQWNTIWAFLKSGSWNEPYGTVIVSKLENIWGTKVLNSSFTFVSDTVQWINKNSRLILRDESLREKVGRVDTTNTAQLTSKTCIEGLDKAIERLLAAVSSAGERQKAKKGKKNYSKNTAENRWLFDTRSAWRARCVNWNANPTTSRFVPKFLDASNLAKL